MNSMSSIIKGSSDQDLLDLYDKIYEQRTALERQQKAEDKAYAESRRSHTFSRTLAKEKLLQFATYTKDDYEINEHHELVAFYLDLWRAGIIPKLIINQPPQTGKSELASRRLPALILGHDPDAKIMNITYGATLARDFNNDVQRIIDSDHYRELFPETKLPSSANARLDGRTYKRNSEIFEILGHTGSYASWGIDGAITGKGATHLILDDLIKGAREAFSKVSRDFVWNTYQSTIRPRLAKKGKILFLSTRWHEDDLVGRLLKNEPDQWVVLNFPLIKTTALNDNNYDFRDVGETLWENKTTLEEAVEIRANTSAYWWSSLFQGQPTPEGGSTIKEEWFEERYETLPPLKDWVRVVQSWDTAFEEKETNDFSVCTVWLETKTRYFLMYVYRARVSFPKLKAKAKELYDKFNPPGGIGMEVLVEKKASGHSLIQELRLGKIPVRAIKVDKGKRIRFEAASPTFESGKVVLPYEAPWLDEYIEELVQGLNGAFDDQIDSTTQAINHMKGAVCLDDFLEEMEKIEEENAESGIYDKIASNDWHFLSDASSQGKAYEHEFDQDEDDPQNALNNYEKVMKGVLD